MANMWSKMGANIGALLGPKIGSILGSILGLEWAKRRQGDLNENIYEKCDSITGKPYFSDLGGSQDKHKRLREAPKRHLKSFKAS